MTPKSAKAKGRLLQQLFVQYVLEAFPTLTEHDVKSTTMGEGGTDTQLSTAARQLFPYVTEIRKHEKFNIWKAIEDVSRHAEKEGLTPLVIFARNRVRPKVAMDLEDFFTLIKQAKKGEPA